MNDKVNSMDGSESVADLERSVLSADVAMIFIPKCAIIRFLDRFLDGELQAADLVRMAEILDVNERVFFDEVDRENLIEVIFDLASPEINGSINIDRVESIKNFLLMGESDRSSPG